MFERCPSIEQITVPMVSDIVDPQTWVDTFVSARLGFKRETTIDTYTFILQQFLTWLITQPGHEPPFNPQQDLTQTAIHTYLFGELAEKSISHRERVKSILNGFAGWLIDEGHLTRNPTRGVELPAQAILAPRELSSEQRYILKELIEQEDLRGQTMFALGYYAGCRASDVVWFRIDGIDHLTTKTGQITIGYKRGQLRTIDLMNEARQPLHAYLSEERKNLHPECPFLFLSQRARATTKRSGDNTFRLTEGGLHAWWRSIKEGASHRQWEAISDITFHDLRHDFAHRAREAGWTLEEVAYYLGHVTKKGTPAIQTTARYTQVSREQVKEKLKRVKG